MHKLTDDDLFWTLRPTVAALSASRLNDMKRHANEATALTTQDLIAALRRPGLEVLEFKLPLPVVNDRAANDWEFRKGLADEKTARAIIDALCRLTDKRISAADIVQMALPNMDAPKGPSGPP